MAFLFRLIKLVNKIIYFVHTNKILKTIISAECVSYYVTGYLFIAFETSLNKNANILIEKCTRNMRCTKRIENTLCA